MLTCDCTKAPAGYTAMPLPDGGFCYDLWVCSRCHKPAHRYFERLTYMNHPHRATALLSMFRDGEGRNIIRWATDVSGEVVETMVFHPYPKKVDMPEGRNILVSFWKELDGCIDNIRGANDEHGRLQFMIGQDAETEKIRAKTLAWMLAEIMSPFYEDGNAVLRESMERWTARQSGTTRETPGLAEAIWDPSTRFDGTPYSRDNEAKARGGLATKARVTLDEQKVTFIKHTLTTGAMTPEVLAGMFGCSVEDIKAANDS